MEIQRAIREFHYNSVVLPDPDPSYSIEQARDFFATVYPEIVNAEIEGPEASGNKTIYTFRRAVGTKGVGAIELIAQERARQMAKEGWTPEHDDGHDAGELASAAACYAINAASTLHPYDGLGIQLNAKGEPEVPWWPWDASWWKPKDPLRDLVRAGALIAAEIDRLQRLQGTDTDSNAFQKPDGGFLHAPGDPKDR